MQGANLYLVGSSFHKECISLLAFCNYPDRMDDAGDVA